MGRVRGGFFDTRTRPAGLPLLPRPGPFIKRVFFLAPYPPHWAFAGPVQPFLGLIRGQIRPILLIKKKKKKKRKAQAQTQTATATQIQINQH